MKTSESSILFAVKDLIKIMAMPSNEEMIADERWDFKFIKNAEDSLLLEFEISEGIKRAAPPSFLMAYLLKKQIKAIKKETSVRPSNIAFWAIDKYSEEEKKRIYLQLQEACNTLSNTSAKYKCECEFVLFKM
uniref:Uncharacterized protein n=1 Tax=Panagrolaimus superbus TaxID=310955 RepID=A0A914Z4H6_9BILA